MTDDRKRKTGGEVELLALPGAVDEVLASEWRDGKQRTVRTFPDRDYYTADQMAAYARANVDRALAESRAEVAEYAASARLLAVERAEFRIRAERLTGALREAREMVEDWAQYASSYFQDKHDLKGDITKLDAALNLEPNP